VIAALALLAVLGVALPHLVRLDGARPATAAILWTAALTLRAMTAVSTALFLVLAFPETSAFKDFTHWCVHSVLPVAGLHVDVHGHAIGDLAVLTPAAVIAVSLMVAALGTMRATRVLTATLRWRSLGSGPEDSVIVGGPEVLVGAAGLVHPRIVVSAGALAVLDDEELAAGLAHEHGHIVRRHHLGLAYAECCRAVARPLPGTRRAVRELRFHLERDADEWALRRHHDPRALASAICKAATTAAPADPVMVPLTGGAIERRLDGLLGSERPAIGGLHRRIVDYAAVLMVCVTLTSLVAIPTEALAGVGVQVADHSQHECVR
jgi:Peptidase family M48